MKNILPQDLTVHQFSLKKIVENLDKIPERTGKFGEPSNNLSKDEKKKLYELIRKFNEYGHSLRNDQALMETAKTLSEIAQMAKKYAMNENNDDFMQKETVQRDFKQVENITGQFQKLAKECVSRTMQLSALYEDLGHIYERYYEMENLNEIAPPAAPETNLPMSETTDECGDCGCGDPNHIHNGDGLGQDDHTSGLEENTLNEGTCRDCNGSGKCSHCKGSGEVRTY